MSRDYVDGTVALSEWASDRLLEISNNTERTADLIAEHVADDLATRVAADIFARESARCIANDPSGHWEEGVREAMAEEAIALGRIFAEAVAKEGK